MHDHVLHEHHIIWRITGIGNLHRLGRGEQLAFLTRRPRLHDGRRIIGETVCRPQQQDEKHRPSGQEKQTLSEVGHNENPMPKIDQKSDTGIALTPRRLKHLRLRLTRKRLDLDRDHV